LGGQTVNPTMPDRARASAEVAALARDLSQLTVLSMQRSMSLTVCLRTPTSTWTPTGRAASKTTASRRRISSSLISQPSPVEPGTRRPFAYGAMWWR